LPVDDVLVAVPHGTGAQGRQIGARLRFGVTDREVDVTGENPRQELLLLCVAAKPLQSRPDGLQRDSGQRYIGTVGFVDEDLLLDRSVAEAPELLGPADAD